MVTAPKRRSRRRKYKTGVHVSPKSPKPMEYRSGWEYEVMKYLDKDPKVVSYEYEPFSIPYLSNTRTGKIRQYFPDFLIVYDTGIKKLVEVKRLDKLEDAKVQKKMTAAKSWCSTQGIVYETWTNELIKLITKSNEIMNPKKKPPIKAKRTIRKKH